MAIRYEYACLKNHPGKEGPAKGLVSKAETESLQIKQPLSVNTLSVKDLEKLKEFDLGFTKSLSHKGKRDPIKIGGLLVTKNVENLFC